MSWKMLFPTPAKATAPRESRPQPRSYASRAWVSDCRPNRHPLVRSAPLKVSTAIYNRHPVELVPAHLFRTRRDTFPGLVTPPVATPRVRAVHTCVASAVRTVARFQTTATGGCRTREKRLVVVVDAGQWRGHLFPAAPPDLQRKKVKL